MISKELLTAIRKDNYTVVDIDYFYEIDDKKIGYLLDNEQWYYINIYELAHKCKEWAYSQGCVLFSKIRLNSSLASCYFDAMGKHDYEDGYHNDFRAETEPEAIFKACEWILTKDSK